MDANHYTNRPSNSNTPPLSPIETMGTLHYSENPQAPMKVDISGSIDKGFFQSDNEWTCYRRNYFNCICSFTLNPHYPNVPIQFVSSDTSHPTQTLQVYGFAMCISAVIADNDQHNIELIQHTPKRDKGPIANPDKVVLASKQGSGPHHPLSMYNDSSGVGATRGMYTDGNYSSQSGAPATATEHTFERIQFKQATQNNGKRRAAQQYYHLLVELWGDTGNQTAEQFVKIAHRKSAKMIVRGRSPGHYQTDRRGSHSSGPGGGSTGMGYSGMGGMGDFTPGGMLGGGGGYGGGYDTRGGMYGVRQHGLPAEAPVSTEDEKTLEDTKGYQYFPGTVYDNGADRVDMYTNRGGSEASVVPHMATGMDIGGKMNPGDGLPRFFHPPPLASDRRSFGPFQGKPSSNGYYPTVMSPPGTNITMT